MRIHKFLLLLTLLPIRLGIHAQAYIQGKIKGNAPTTLLVYSPVNGFANNILVQDGSSVAINASGEFSCTLELKNSCFVTLKIGSEPIWLLLQPGDSLHINVNLDSITKFTHKGWLHIAGNNSDGHLYFNEYNFQPYDKLIPVIDLFESVGKKPIDLIKAARDTLSRAIKPLDDLLKENKITPVYHAIASKTVKANLLNEAFKFFFRGSSSLYTAYSNKEIDSLKKNLFALCDPLDTSLYKGLNTDFYLYDFYLQKELACKTKRLQKELRDSVLETGNGKKLLVRGDFTPFLHITDKRLQEYLWGRTLYGMSTITSAPPDAQSMESFSFFFPESLWLIYLNRFETEIRERQKISLTNSDEIKYLDSTQSVKSFGEIIGQLKGQPLFIDVWASWCIPCRQEFLSKNSVDSFLSAKGIAKVYISIDEPIAKKSWRNAIDMYNLKGYHILAGPQLIQELINKVYDGDKNLPIPRYLIVDSTGNIVERDAPRPSNDLKLIEQIKIVLQLN